LKFQQGQILLVIQSIKAIAEEVEIPARTDLLVIQSIEATAKEDEIPAWTDFASDIIRVEDPYLLH
jgi:hypothetical protein